MRVYYEETYGAYYETENAETLLEDIRNGKEDGPETCVGSVIAELIGNGDPQYQIMGAEIDALSDHEKKFYLWYLLRYFYKRELLKDKEKYPDDPTTQTQISRLLNNIDEIDTLLGYDIF